VSCRIFFIGTFLLLGIIGFIIGVTRGQYFEGCLVLLIFGGVASMMKTTVFGKIGEPTVDETKVRVKRK